MHRFYAQVLRFLKNIEITKKSQHTMTSRLQTQYRLQTYASFLPTSSISTRALAIENLQCVWLIQNRILT